MLCILNFNIGKVSHSKLVSFNMIYTGYQAGMAVLYYAVPIIPKELLFVL